MEHPAQFWVGITLKSGSVFGRRQQSIVFYDLTTIRTEGLSEQQGDGRRYGMSKEGLVARQFMLGVVLDSVNQHGR